MAHTGSGISFGPYRLDLAAGRLWRGDVPVAIQPRPLAVLAYLAERPGAVVGRDELIARLWAGTYVTRAVLKVAVRAVREALGDDADAPRYLETVGREGYRFIGLGDAPTAAAPARDVVVGRRADLDTLHASLATARAGARTLVVVSGEAGVGKTTLLDRFVGEVQRDGDVRVARGQCLEQYGEGEAYLPVLEALGTLARDEPRLADVLARHAPSWLPHLPALGSGARPHAAPSATTMPARMLREVADALEALTRDVPLVLVLEDLQWSDRSSVDLLAYLAVRRQPARLLVVGSVRADELREHPLLAVQRELQAKGLCTVLALSLLSRDDVEAHVAAAYPGLAPATRATLATRVWERTEGHALFMVNMLNDLVASGLLARGDDGWRVDGAIEPATAGVPSGLRALLDRRLEALAPPQRALLEAASVAGADFTVEAVAAALGGDAVAVEDACEQLAAQGALLADAGIAEWPDGTVCGRYRFRHALYRQGLYEGIAAARRARLHRAVGEREAAGFGAAAAAHAAELAMHFTRAHDHERALDFHALAATAALDRHAAHEAVAHQTAALDALARLPDGPARAPRELGLVVGRATLRMAILGYAAPDTEADFARARALCASLPPGPALYPVLRGLVSYHHVRADLDAARTLGIHLLGLAAERPDDPLLHVQAHYGHGATLFHVGDLAGARRHLAAALEAYDPARHRDHIRIYGGYDPGVACALWLAWTATFEGEIEEAVARTRDGLALAERHGDAFTLAWAWHAVGVSEQLFGDWQAARRASGESMRLAEEHGFPHVLGMATANQGLNHLACGDPTGGIAMLRDGVAQVDRTGAALVRPSYLGMLARAHLVEGDRAAALARLDDALAELERTGERVFEATLLLQKAQMLAATSRSAAAAEATFRRALDVAHAQGARLLALRAALAWARWRGGRGDARPRLADAYAWFADRPAALPDVVAARKLLDATAG